MPASSFDLLYQQYRNEGDTKAEATARANASIASAPAAPEYWIDENGRPWISKADHDDHEAYITQQINQFDTTKPQIDMTNNRWVDYYASANPDSGSLFSKAQLEGFKYQAAALYDAKGVPRWTPTITNVGQSVEGGRGDIDWYVISGGPQEDPRFALRYKKPTGVPDDAVYDGMSNTWFATNSAGSVGSYKNEGPSPTVANGYRWSDSMKEWVKDPLANATTWGWNSFGDPSTGGVTYILKDGGDKNNPSDWQGIDVANSMIDPALLATYKTASAVGTKDGKPTGPPVVPTAGNSWADKIVGGIMTAAGTFIGGPALGAAVAVGIQGLASKGKANFGDLLTTGVLTYAGASALGGIGADTIADITVSAAENFGLSGAQATLFQNVLQGAVSAGINATPASIAQGIKTGKWDDALKNIGIAASTGAIMSPVKDLTSELGSAGQAGLVGTAGNLVKSGLTGQPVSLNNALTAGVIAASTQGARDLWNDNKSSVINALTPEPTVATIDPEIEGVTLSSIFDKGGTLDDARDYGFTDEELAPYMTNLRNDNNSSVINALTPEPTVATIDPEIDGVTLSSIFDEGGTLDAARAYGFTDEELAPYMTTVEQPDSIDQNAALARGNINYGVEGWNTPADTEDLSTRVTGLINYPGGVTYADGEYYDPNGENILYDPASGVATYEDGQTWDTLAEEWEPWDEEVIDEEIDPETGLKVPKIKIPAGIKTNTTPPPVATQPPPTNVLAGQDFSSSYAKIPNMLGAAPAVYNKPTSAFQGEAGLNNPGVNWSQNLFGNIVPQQYIPQMGATTEPRFNFNSKNALNNNYNIAKGV